MKRDLRQALNEVREREYNKRAHQWEARRCAVGLFFALEPGMQKWWAIAFQIRYRKLRAAGHDLDKIVGHDTLAQEMALYYPEYRDAEVLWDFLLSPHNAMPSAAWMRREAEELLEASADREPVAAGDYPAEWDLI